MLAGGSGEVSPGFVSDRRPSQTQLAIPRTEHEGFSYGTGSHSNRGTS